MGICDGLTDAKFLGDVEVDKGRLLAAHLDRVDHIVATSDALGAISRRDYVDRAAGQGCYGLDSLHGLPQPLLVNVHKVDFGVSGDFLLQ